MFQHKILTKRIQTEVVSEFRFITDHVIWRHPLMGSNLESMLYMFIRLSDIINRILNLKDLVLFNFPFFPGSLNEVI